MRYDSEGRASVGATNPVPGVHVVVVSTPGRDMPVASCGSAERARIVETALRLLIVVDPAIVDRLADTPRVAVPTRLGEV